MSYRFGILGPTARSERLREALRFLLVDAEADRVFCLSDPHFVRREMQTWARQFARIGAGSKVSIDTLERAAGGEVAMSQWALAALLDAETDLPAERARDLRHAIQALRRLQCVDVLPDSRSKVIEFAGARCITMVLDKSSLSEDDVANASLVLYGRALQAEFRRFGKRCFFSPGPADAEQVGLLELHDSEATITLFNLDGMPVWKEPVLSAGSRLSVRGENTGEILRPPLRSVDVQAPNPSSGRDG